MKNDTQILKLCLYSGYIYFFKRNTCEKVFFLSSFVTDLLDNLLSSVGYKFLIMRFATFLSRDIAKKSGIAIYAEQNSTLLFH